MKKNFFERFSDRAVCFTGNPFTFIISSLMVIIWITTGPLFNFSETGQFVINIVITITTFLMVFLIQKMPNKDSKAIQITLNRYRHCSMDKNNLISL